MRLIKLACIFCAVVASVLRITPNAGAAEAAALPGRDQVRSLLEASFAPGVGRATGLQTAARTGVILVARTVDFGYLGGGSKALAWVEGSEPALSHDGRRIAYWRGAGTETRFCILDVMTGKTRDFPQLTGLRLPKAGVDVGFRSNAPAWNAQDDGVFFSLDRPAPPADKAPPWLAEGAGSAIPPSRTYAGSALAASPLLDAIGLQSAYADDDQSNIRSYIVALDVKSGRLATVFSANDKSYVGPTVSPDGKLLVAYERNPALGTMLGGGRIVAIDLRRQRIVATSARYTWLGGGPVFAPDGKHLAFLAKQGFLGVFRVHVASTLGLADVTVGPDLPVDHTELRSDITWQDRHTLKLSAKHGIHSEIHTVSTDGLELAAPLVRNSYIRGIGMLPDKSLVLVESDERSPLVVTSLRDGREEVLFSLTTHLPESVVPRAVVDVSATNSLGEPVAARLLLPAHPNALLPKLIVDPYPGAASYQYVPGNEYGSMQVFLSQGYAVLFVTTHQPVNPTLQTYSQRYMSDSVGPQGLRRMVDDFGSVMEEIKRRGLVDTDHACGFGHSNGGATLAYFIAFSGLLKCAVISAPAFMDAAAFPSDPTAGVYSREVTGAPAPWANAGFYDGLDILFMADHVKTPVLLLDGDRDPVFPSTVRMYQGVRAAGGPVDFVAYPGQPHFPDIATRADALWRALAFVDAHLRGEGAAPGPTPP